MTQPTYRSPCKNKVIFTRLDYRIKDTYLTSEREIFNLIPLMLVDEDILVPLLNDIFPNELLSSIKGDCPFL